MRRRMRALQFGPGRRRGGAAVEAGEFRRVQRLRHGAQPVRALRVSGAGVVAEKDGIGEQRDGSLHARGSPTRYPPGGVSRLSPPRRRPRERPPPPGARRCGRGCRAGRTSSMEPTGTTRGPRPAPAEPMVPARVGGRELDGAPARGALHRPQATRPLPLPHLASRSQGRPPRRPRPRRRAAHGPQILPPPRRRGPGNRRAARALTSPRTSPGNAAASPTACMSNSGVTTGALSHAPPAPGIPNPGRPRPHLRTAAPSPSPGLPESPSPLPRGIAGLPCRASRDAGGMSAHPGTVPEFPGFIPPGAPAGAAPQNTGTMSFGSNATVSPSIPISGIAGNATS